jgi:hypothetical protein
VAVAVALVVLAALAPFVAEITAQPASRFAAAAAIVDDGTIRIDGYRDQLSASDFVERDGHVYSDKAPGQLLVAVPAYASARLVGADAPQGRFAGDLGAWWITLWTSMVPAAALAALIYWTVASRFPNQAVAVAMAFAFGTLLLVFTTQMYPHALSALLGFGAWTVALRRPLRTRDAVLAGALAGCAVTVELSLVIVALMVVALLLHRRQLSGLAWFALGAAPFGIALLLYQRAAYGSPLRSAYVLKDNYDAPTVLELPRVDFIAQSLFSGKGALVVMPVVLLALAGALLLWRDRPPDRTTTVAAVVAFGAFMLVHAAMKEPFGGEMPGPRFVIPALPFLAMPLARAWKEWPRACLAAAAVGGLLLCLGVFTVHLVLPDASVLGQYRDNLQVFGVTPTTYTMAIGPAGWLVHVVVLAAALLHLQRTVRHDVATRPVSR